MQSIEVLEKLGLLIRNYFKYITPQNEKYNLCVDEFLFDNFLERLQTENEIQHKTVYSALRSAKCDFHGNPFIAMAIAAYQVVVFYTLDASTTSDAYNEKLFSSKAYNGMTYSDYWYDSSNSAPSEGEALQEKMWALLKRSFRINDIPNNMRFGARDRYVQYPKSQNILGSSMRTFRIQYADRFIQLNLEPNSGIAYETFEKLVFNRNQYFSNKMLRRLVFSFYCMWDGRTYHEILNHITKNNIEQKAKDEFLIQLQPEVRFFVNGQRLDLSKDKIDDKYLWKFNENKYLTRKASVFIKDNDYKDYLPLSKNKAVDIDEEILILSVQKEFPQPVESLIESGKIEFLNMGKYSVLVLTDTNRDDLEMLGINVKPIPYLQLVGGLKLKRNTYYDFALPAIQLTDKISNKITYKSIYIDLKEYPLKNGFCKIEEKLSVGKHCVKLLNSWDASEVHFTVEKAEIADFPENHGWCFDFQNISVMPSCEKSEIVIDGLAFTKELEWIERKNKSEIKPSWLRNFEKQNERLLFRFNLHGNEKISQRGRYGN